MTVRDIVSKYQKEVFTLMTQMNVELNQFGVCLDYMRVDTIDGRLLGTRGIFLDNPEIRIKVK